MSEGGRIGSRWMEPVFDVPVAADGVRQLGGVGLFGGQGGHGVGGLGAPPAGAGPAAAHDLDGLSGVREGALASATPAMPKIGTWACRWGSGAPRASLSSVGRAVNCTTGVRLSSSAGTRRVIDPSVLATWPLRGPLTHTRLPTTDGRVTETRHTSASSWTISWASSTAARNASITSLRSPLSARSSNSPTDLGET